MEPYVQLRPTTKTNCPSFKELFQQDGEESDDDSDEEHREDENRNDYGGMSSADDPRTPADETIDNENPASGGNVDFSANKGDSSSLNINKEEDMLFADKFAKGVISKAALEEQI